MDEERFDYEVDDATRFVDNLKDRVHDLYDKNEELKEENKKLNKGYCKFKEQCGNYATCLRENQIKEIERLNNIIKTKDEGIKAFTEDLCEESTKIEKATEYIKKHTYHGTPKKLQNGIYERGILLIKSDFDIEEVLEILDKEKV